MEMNAGLKPQIPERMGTDRAATGDLVLHLGYQPPYDWQHVLEFLGTRAVPGVERVDQRGYARTICCDGTAARILLRQLPQGDALALHLAGVAEAAMPQVRANAVRMSTWPQTPSGSWRDCRLIPCSGRWSTAVPASGFPAHGMPSNAQSAQSWGSR